MAKQTKKQDKPVTTAQRLGSKIKSARDIMRKDKGLNGELDRLPQLTWILFLKLLDDSEQLREYDANVDLERTEPFKPAIEYPYRWRDWAENDEGMSGDPLKNFINNDEVTLPDGTRCKGLFAYLRSLQTHIPQVADRVRGILGKDPNWKCLKSNRQISTIDNNGELEFLKS